MFKLPRWALLNPIVLLRVHPMVHTALGGSAGLDKTTSA